MYINEQFESFLTHSTEDLSEAQIDEYKAVFYAGAMAQMRIYAEIANTKVSHKKMIAIIKVSYDEINNFFSEKQATKN
jgi:hypothetical protein